VSSLYASAISVEVLAYRTAPLRIAGTALLIVAVLLLGAVLWQRTRARADVRLRVLESLTGRWVTVHLTDGSEDHAGEIREVRDGRLVLVAGRAPEALTIERVQWIVADDVEYGPW
jgi:cation transport ATPase